MPPRSAAPLPPPPRSGSSVRSVASASAARSSRVAARAARRPAHRAETRIFMVRLKPYNPKRGYKLRRYHVYGQRFDEDRGWYRIRETIQIIDPNTKDIKTINLADYLREVRQNQHDEDARFAFDVCTVEEAAAIDRREDAALQKQERARPSNPNDLTTRQIRGGNTESDDTSAAAKRRAAATAHRVSRLADAPDENDFDPDADLGQP